MGVTAGYIIDIGSVFLLKPVLIMLLTFILTDSKKNK